MDETIENLYALNLITQSDYERLTGIRKALQEAVNIVEGKARRSPWEAVEDWKKLLSA